MQANTASLTLPAQDVYLARLKQTLLEQLIGIPLDPWHLGPAVPHLICPRLNASPNWYRIISAVRIFTPDMVVHTIPVRRRATLNQGKFTFNQPEVADLCVGSSALQASRDMVISHYTVTRLFSFPCFKSNSFILCCCYHGFQCLFFW